MIKSLLDADEEPLKENPKSEGFRETSLTAPLNSPESTAKPDADVSDSSISGREEKAIERKVEPFEIADPIGMPKFAETEPQYIANEKSETDQILPITDPKDGSVLTDLSSTESSPIRSADESASINVTQKEFTPDTLDETVRKTGLASSAAIVLFGSVTFMMLFGWFADFTFGTTPWGVVAGIIVGAVIGFVQFFRTTAQILRPPKSEINKIPIYSRIDEDDTE
ncbi:MAG: AtpZ/AtpI family protein [Pyrinomonadaceae bacterium]